MAVNSQSDLYDFEIEIGTGAGREYPVAVLRSPAGEIHQKVIFPLDDLALENRLQSLEIALLRSGGKFRQVLSSEEKAVQEFGKLLFDTVFTGEARNLYQLSWDMARRNEKGLRLKLRIQAPELANVPWEYMYDTRQAEYICLSKETPVIRYIDIPQPISPLAVSLPLRVLGMISSPTDLPALDVQREKQRLEIALQNLHNLVELHWVQGQTWRDIQREMRNGSWHLFHFIGHGGFDDTADQGFIALANENGKMHAMLASELSRLLGDHPSLRLVILNACESGRGSGRDLFSGTASILIRRGIPAALAMQYPITDQAAIEFARAFYDALVDGLPVDLAVCEGRKAISLAVNNSVEWGVPVLYMRSPDGRLFEIAPGTAKPAKPVETFPYKPQGSVEEYELEATFQEALEAVSRNDLVLAHKKFSAVRKVNPDYKDVDGRLADVENRMDTIKGLNDAKELMRSNRWEKAIKLLESLLEKRPANIDILDLLEEAKYKAFQADLASIRMPKPREPKPVKPGEGQTREGEAPKAAPIQAPTGVAKRVLHHSLLFLRDIVVFFGIMVGFYILMFLLTSFGVEVFASWPIVIVGAGVFELVISLVIRKSSLTISASMLIGIGAILYYQYLHGSWEIWSYVWTAIPGFWGVGNVIAGLLDKNQAKLKWGGIVILISTILLILLGSFTGAFARNNLPVTIAVLGVFLGCGVIAFVYRKRRS